MGCFSSKSVIPPLPPEDFNLIPVQGINMPPYVVKPLPSETLKEEIKDLQTHGHIASKGDIAKKDIQLSNLSNVRSSKTIEQLQDELLELRRQHDKGACVKKMQEIEEKTRGLFPIPI